MSNPIDVNFHLKKRLETFDKNSADKVQSKMVKGIKVSSFMAIRVKALGWKKGKICFGFEKNNQM